MLEAPKTEKKIDPVEAELGASPFDYSPVPEKVGLENTDTTITFKHGKRINGKITYEHTTVSVFKDKNTGELYVEKHPEKGADDQSLETEYFISLLTKNIFHSSDMIKVDGKYFSRIIDLKRTKTPEKGELEAELFLLAYIFSDNDKNVPERNLVIDKDGRFAHYDYGRSFIESKESLFSSIFYSLSPLPDRIQRELFSVEQHGEPLNITRRVKTKIEGATGIQLRKKNPKIQEYILAKTQKILNTLEDANFFEAVVEKSKFNTRDKRFNYLQQTNEKLKIEELKNILKSKCEKLIEILEKEKPTTATQKPDWSKVNTNRN